HRTPTGPIRSGPVATSMGVFDAWHQLEPLLRRRPSDPDANLVRELRRKFPLDLGKDLGAWIHWVRLGLWFDDPHREPRPPRSSVAIKQPTTGGIDWVEDRWTQALFDQILSDRSKGGLQQAMRQLLLFTAERPDDARGWLALGLIFDS